MFNVLLTKSFEAFILPKWYALAAKIDSPRFWKTAFMAASELTPELPIQAALDLSQGRARSVYRLLINSFKPEKRFPTASDFALAIGMELSHGDFEYRNINPAIIRKFATNLRREWCKTLNSQPIIKNYLKDRRDIHPAAVINKDDACDYSGDEVLSSKQSLKRAYFESYSEIGGTDEVRVWLSNDQGWVDYDLNRTATVKLHSVQGADSGFFLKGYDYSLIKGDKSFHLRRCHQNLKLGVETAEFSGHTLGDLSGPLLWSL